MNNQYAKEVVGYLVFSQVVITNANAISSPITYGFPAVTGFLGSFHAMSRKLANEDSLNPFSLGGVLLACHDCQPQVYRASKYSNYTFNQSRNPIKRDGKTASIVEEGKVHLVMSFVVEVLGKQEPLPEQQTELINKTSQWIQQQRMAGGSVHGLAQSVPVQFVNYEDIDLIAVLLLPAFVLMDAQEAFSEIIAEMQQHNPDATALDALLDVCTIHHIPERQKDSKVKWQIQSRKSGRGWLVPMPVGYQGISKKYAADIMQNIRNPEYPSQYVEVIYGLGKWVYPQRLKQSNHLQNAFWRYQYDTEKSLYCVTQQDQLGV